MEDLVQVATLGLILAVDRYDATRGISFRHFAMPTITGELKRHFRDKGWGIRVSRRLQESYQAVRRAEPELAQNLGRTPTVTDLADHLGLSTEDVEQAKDGAALYTTRSLNWPSKSEDEGGEVSDRLGSWDPNIEGLADRDALYRALALLPRRLREIVSLRFVDELTQVQIADKMGISQMHVSRLLGRSLTMLRRHMTAEPPTRMAA
jgi:RNA polymerase sigma-B factor